MILTFGPLRNVFSKSFKSREELEEKNLVGNVIIQTLEPAHSVLQNCMTYSFKSFTMKNYLKGKKQSSTLFKFYFINN